MRSSRDRWSSVRMNCWSSLDAPIYLHCASVSSYVLMHMNCVCSPRTYFFTAIFPASTLKSQKYHRHVLRARTWARGFRRAFSKPKKVAPCEKDFFARILQCMRNCNEGIWCYLYYRWQTSLSMHNQNIRRYSNEFANLLSSSTRIDVDKSLSLSVSCFFIAKFPSGSL